MTYCAYVTGEEEGEASELHEWAGYIVGGIVAFRVMERDAERVDNAARKQHGERLARQRSHDGIKGEQHDPALKKVEREWS